MKEKDTEGGKEFVKDLLRDFLSDCGYELTMQYGYTQEEADKEIKTVVEETMHPMPNFDEE